MTTAAITAALTVRSWDYFSLGYGWTDLTAEPDRDNSATDYRSANLNAYVLFPSDEVDNPRTETPVKFSGEIGAYLSAAETEGADRIFMYASMLTPKKSNEWISVECGFDNIKDATIDKPEYNLRVDNYIGNERMQVASAQMKDEWRVGFRESFVESHEVFIMDGSSGGGSMGYDDMYIDYLSTCDSENDSMC